MKRRSLAGVATCRGLQRITGHGHGETADIDYGIVQCSAVVANGKVEVDAADRFGQRIVLETAVGDLQVDAECRQHVALEFAPGPHAEGQRSRCRQVLEIPCIECGDHRKQLLETHLRTVDGNIHGDGVVTSLDPAVDAQLDSIEPQHIVRKSIPAVIEIGGDGAFHLGLGVVQQPHSPVREVKAAENKMQAKIGLRGRHVTAQAQVHRRYRKVHARRIVVVRQDGVGYAQVANLKPE